jgi:putative toxin-antitoxin system antitoxin component (TIGR02293 family)
MMKESLEFYDVKSKSKFKSTDWGIEKKISGEGRIRYFAVSKSPAGTHMAWRMLPSRLVEEMDPWLTLERPHVRQGAAFVGVQASTLGKLIEKIEEGLPYKTFEKLTKLMDVSASEMGRVLHISPRTLIRRKKSGILSEEESERVLRLSRITYATLGLFEGNREAAVAWLKRRNRALGQETPLEMSSTEIGGEEVLNLIGRLEHGVFS